MNTNPSNFVPRGGAIRYEDAGVYHCANPGSPYYSTMLFLATERWNATTQRWELIFEDE